MTPWEYWKAGALAVFVIAALIVSLGIHDWLDSTASDVHLAEIDADRQIGTLVSRADKQIADAITAVNSATSAADKETNAALLIASRAADRLTDPAAGVTAVLDRQLTTANRTLSQTADQLTGPMGSVTVLAQRYTLLPDELAADRETKGLIAETMGVLGAAKVTMGETARTMKTMQDQMPGISLNIASASAMSAQASANAAHVMGNLAAATKPLPVWLRIGLAVAPPLAQTAAAAATAWSLIP